jgi:hypothetical protein
MTQSTSDSRKKRTRNILVALGAIAAVLVAVLLVLGRPHPGPIEDPPISDACWDQLGVQQRLAELAIRAMETYGRIDPALYDVASDNDRIRVDPSAQPLEPREDAEPLRRFQAALQTINDNERLRRALRAGHSDALKACAGYCPPNVYPVDLTLVSVPKNPEAGLYKWKEKKDVPTDPEWTLGFLNLYGGAPIASCPFAPPLELIKDYASAQERAQTTPPDGPKTGTPAPAEPARQSETRTFAAEPPRNYSAGMAALRDSCVTKKKELCAGCTLPQGGYGAYYWNGVKWCCGAC